MQKPGFCRKLLDRHCLKKTGFLKISATKGSNGDRVYPLTLSSKSAPIRGENWSKQQPMQS